MIEQPDSYYIDKVLQGESNAFSTLLSRYRNLVFTLCVKIIGNTDEAEDIAQETFVKAYQSISKYNGSAKFSSWLYRIAYNACMDHLKKKKRVKEKEEEASFFQDQYDESSLKELSDSEKSTYIKEALNQLPELDRAILTLFYYQDESVGEIAKTLKISLSNVKIKLHRSRKVLKGVFEKEREFLDI